MADAFGRTITVVPLFVRGRDMPSQSWRSDGSLPRSLEQAFAPVHKSALGVAVGFSFGTLLAIVTAFHVIAQPTVALPLELLGQYFYGYRLSWLGVALGFGWGMVTGFVAGWFVAFVRNFALALWLLSARAKAELSSPFLDHI